MRFDQPAEFSGHASETPVAGESQFFRFATAIAIVTCVGLISIAIEKQILSLKRSISLQHYQISQIHEQHARLKLRIAERSTPAVLLETMARKDTRKTRTSQRY